MFFAEDRIKAVREMICARTVEARKVALATVSYTHLDVYKRQVSGWAKCRQCDQSAIGPSSGSVLYFLSPQSGKMCIRDSNTENHARFSSPSGSASGCSLRICVR